MPQRKKFVRRTVTSFTKTYGDRVYSFHHTVTEVPGFSTAITTVRRKPKGAPRTHVGKTVHVIAWEKETNDK